MAKIKTKETVKDIKALDKAADVSTRMKETFVRTKERTASLNDDGQNSANEYAENQVESGMRDAAYDVGHGAKDGTKKAIRKGKETYRNHKDLKDAELKKEPDATGSNSNQIQRNKNKTAAKNSTEHKKYRIKTRDSKKHTIKQSARSTGKKTVKTSRATIKHAEKTVKTAEKTTRKAIKTAEKTAKATKEAAKVSAKAAQKAAQAAKAATKAAVATAKAAAKAIVAAVKAIIAGVKALVAAIAAGGWVAVIIIIVICLIALIVGSCFGIFFGGEDTGTGQTMQTAVQEINIEYNNKIQEIKNNTKYDECEICGNQTSWKDLLAVYAVKVSHDSNDPQEIATMDSGKKAILVAMFWENNTISSKTENRKETVVVEIRDAAGNVTSQEIEVTKIWLIITVESKSLNEMIEYYHFNEIQRSQVAELCNSKYDLVWNDLIK